LANVVAAQVPLVEVSDTTFVRLFEIKPFWGLFWESE
jgi:hypothetical protein